jgi:hypothetical protein
MQVDKNVEREILNHRMLLNANVVSFKEVRHTQCLPSSAAGKLQVGATS